LLNKENFVAQETLMVGDLIEHDILPAQKLGMKTAYIGAAQTDQADYSFSKIQDLFDFLKK
jgi:putative hydrolase of the HAD superfamily